MRKGRGSGSASVAKYVPSWMKKIATNARLNASAMSNAMKLLEKSNRDTVREREGASLTKHPSCSDVAAWN
jgi:hypothetical protein